MSIYVETEKVLKAVVDSVMVSVDNNQFYKPVIGTDWIRVTLMPGKSNTISLGLNGYSEHQGVYRIDLFVDKGADITKANQIVDKLIETFKANPVLSPQDINKYSEDFKLFVGEVWRETTRYETVWTNIPIYVAWRSIIQSNNT